MDIIFTNHLGVVGCGTKGRGRGDWSRRRSGRVGDGQSRKEGGGEGAWRRQWARGATTRRAWRRGNDDAVTSEWPSGCAVRLM
jgi:hypothetical protein